MDSTAKAASATTHRAEKEKKQQQVVNRPPTTSPNSVTMKSVLNTLVKLKKLERGGDIISLVLIPMASFVCTLSTSCDQIALLPPTIYQRTMHHIRSNHLLIHS
jgi:hypothetical protein